MLDVLRKHPLEPQCDREQRSHSQTHGARGATPFSVAEAKESPNLPAAQSPQSDAANIDHGTELRPLGFYVALVVGGSTVRPLAIIMRSSMNMAIPIDVQNQATLNHSEVNTQR